MMLQILLPRSLRTFLLFIIFIFAASKIQADIIHVPSDQSTIIEAIVAANPGDVIVIAAGTYAPIGDLDLNSMGTPGDLAITAAEGAIVIINDSFNTGNISLVDGAGFTNSLTLYGIQFDGVRVNLANATNLIVANCQFDNIAAGGYAINFDKATSTIDQLVLLKNNLIQNNLSGSIQLRNASGQGFNVVIEDNQMFSNASGMFILNEAAGGTMLATIMGNEGNTLSGGQGIMVTNNSTLSADYYIANNAISDVGFGIYAELNTGFGTVRIVDNEQAGTPAIDNYSLAGIQVALTNDAQYEVEIDNNNLGFNAANSTGISYTIGANTASFNTAKISNNIVNMTNAGVHGISVTPSDGSNSASADVELINNFVPGSANANFGINLVTGGTFILNTELLGNNASGSAAGFGLDASGGGSIVFATPDGGIAGYLSNQGNTGSFLDAGTVDFATGVSLNTIFSVGAPFVSDLTDAQITGNAPGFGQITFDELLTMQSIGVPLGSQASLYTDGTDGMGQIIPLFNSPIGLDRVFFVTKNFDGLLTSALITFDISSPQENALHFDPVLNNFVNISIPTGNLADLGEDRTVELWMKRASLAPSGVQHVYSYGGIHGSGSAHFGLTIDTSTGILTFLGGGLGNSFTTTHAIGDLNWHHVAITYSSPNVIVYLDGSAQSTGGISLSTTTTDIELGKDNQNVNGYFDGAIDEFIMFNDVRTLGEVGNDAQLGVVTTEPGLVAYYKFNQGEVDNGGSNSRDNTLITHAKDELENFDGQLNNFTLAENDNFSNFVSSLAPASFSADVIVYSTEGDVILEAPAPPNVLTDTDWETQATGSTVTKHYGITNVGLTLLDLTVGTITVSNTGINGEFVVFPNSPPSNLAPGDTHYIDVDYTPTTTNTIVETIDIPSNDGGGSPYSFQITGTGSNIIAEIDVESPGGQNITTGQGADNFFDTEFTIGINSSLARTFTIFNRSSTTPLSVSSITSSNPEFVIADATGGSVPALGSATFSVTYQAINDFYYGEHNTTITINNGDPNEGTFIFDMRVYANDNALDFDGSQQDNKVSITNNALLVPTTTSSKTYEAWVNPRSNGSGTIMASYTNGGNANFLIELNTGSLSVSGNGTDNFLSNSPIQTGVWTHIAVVFEDGDEKSQIYINGVLDAVGTLTLNIPNGGTAIEFGGRSGTPNPTDWFDGLIDEARIWDGVRDPFDLRANALQSLIGDEANLVAYYSFDEGVPQGGNGDNAAFTVLDDLTTNNFDGTLSAGFDLGNVDNTISNWTYSNEFSSTGLHDIFVSGNVLGSDEEIDDESITPSAEKGTFMGRVNNGNFMDRTFTITNDGLNGLSITSITGATGNFSFIANPGTTTLSPGNSADIVVRFTGDGLGLSTSTISIISDDPDLPEQSYNFLISGLSEPDLALNFDRANSDHMELINGEINVLAARDNWTAEVWVRVTDLTGGNPIWSTELGTGEANLFRIRPDGFIEVTNGANTVTAQSNTLPVQENVWTHIAVVSDNTLAQSFVYINGVAAGMAINGMTLLGNTAASSLFFGRDKTGTNFFSGEMDEFRFWQGNLSDSDISFTSSNSISGNEGGLVVYYRMDEGNAGADNTGIGAPEVADISVNGYSSRLNNFLKNGPNSNWVESYVNTPLIVVRGQSAQIDIKDGENAFGFSDDREFGSVALDGAGGSSIDVIFEIQNQGGVDLDFQSGAPGTVSNSPTDFSIVGQPASQFVFSGNVEFLTVRFDPTTAGTTTETVSLTNNGDAPPFTFDVQGFGGSAPEIDVESAGGTPIVSGAAAVPGNETDMGQTGLHGGIPVNYTIKNTGSAILNIVSITSDNNDFVVSGIPTTVAAVGSATFTVTYQANNTLAYGPHAAVITINNDDGDEGTYIVNLVAEATNNSLDFDGAASILISDAASLHLGTTLTLEAWFKTSSAAAEMRIIEKSGASNGRYALNVDAGILIFRITEPLGPNQDLGSTFSVNDGFWHHVAGTYDGTTMNLYIDGALDNTFIPAPVTTTDGNGPLAIGEEGILARYFIGEIDEVRIWNTTRTPSEIRSNAAATVDPGSNPNLIAYYDFDFAEPAGLTNGFMSNPAVFFDQTANNNDGTLFGFDLGTADANLSNFILSDFISATVPEIAVLGAADKIEIIGDGSNTPTIGNNDHFGVIAPSTTADLNYEIHNWGLAPLTITPSPALVNDLAGDVEIFIQSQPGGGSIQPGTFETVIVRFNPGAAIATFNNGISITNNDADEFSTTINISGQSANVPVISGLGAADDLAYTEDDLATIIDGGTAATISDADSPANLIGYTLTMSISNNIEITEDELLLAHEGAGAGQIDLTINPGNVTIDGDNLGVITGGGAGGADLIITFTSATSTFTDANAIIQKIRYFNNNTSNPVASTRTVSFIMNDGTGDSAPADVDITVSTQNDIPTITGISAADDFTYIEEQVATIIDNASDGTIADNDNPANINGNTLTVSISANRVSTEDILSVVDEGTGPGQVDLLTNVGSITIDNIIVATISGGTGTNDLLITFTVNANFTSVNAVLRKVTYFNSNTAAPSTNARTVSFVFNDGIAPSTAADVVITVNGVNDIPSISNITATADSPFIEGGNPVIIDSDVTFADPEMAATNYDPAIITIERNTPNVDDIFGFNDNGPYVLVATNIEKSGTPVASFVLVGGSLVIDVAAGATLADINAILQNVTYENTNVSVASVLIDFASHDGIDPGVTQNTTFNIFNNDSDIVISGALAPTLNYVNHTGATVTLANGLKVGELSIQDGGGVPDLDGVSTTLDAITLQFTNFDLIQEVALFDQAMGTILATEVALVDAGDGDLDLNEAVFTGLAGFTPLLENGTFEFSVVVTFNAASGILDNTDQIDFTVTSATSNAAGSQFAAADAGGASPALTTENTIIVVANHVEITEFATSIDPTNPIEADVISVILDTDFTMTVQAQDVNGNIDIDFDKDVNPLYQITLAETGPGGIVTSNAGTDPLTKNLENGTVSWTFLQINAIGDYTVVGTDGVSTFNQATTTFSVSSATSQIIEDLTFDYEENFDYTQYNVATLDDTGDNELHIAEFIMVDNGSDGSETELKGITFNITNWENLNELAVIASDGTKEQEVAVTSASVPFNWGNSGPMSVPDGTSVSFGVYATFKQGAGLVDDNEQITLTITNTISRGGGRTQFISAGGGNSTIIRDPGDNTIEVKATHFEDVAGDFGGLLSDPYVFQRETGFSIDIEAQDDNQNIDVDVTGEVSLTFTQGEAISVIPSNFSNGLLSLSNVIINNKFDNGTITIDNVPIDTDLDGIPDVVDVDITLGVDTTPNNGIDDSYEASNTGGADTDGDLIDDFFDPDVNDMIFTDVTIQDTTPPLVITLSPVDDASTLSTNELVITFSEAVQAISGNIEVFNFSDVINPIETINVLDGSKVTIDGAIVTITLDALLPKGNDFFINIDGTAFTDFGANSYVGITGATTWNFSILDGGPAIVSADPPLDNSGTNVPITKSIKLVFDEIVYAPANAVNPALIDITGGTSGTQTFDTKSAADDGVSADGNITGWGTNVITINPTNFNDAAETVTVTVPLDAFEDDVDNPMDAPVVFTFTTVVTAGDIVFDATPPVLSPLDGALAVPVATTQLTMTFGENVQAGDGLIRIVATTATGNLIVKQIRSDHSDVIFDGSPTMIIDISDLTLSGITDYFLRIANGAIEDLSGNTYGGLGDIGFEGDWNFTTGTEAVAPVAIQIDPFKTESGVVVNRNLIIDFNEPVILSNLGVIELKLTTTVVSVESYDLGIDVDNDADPNNAPGGANGTPDVVDYGYLTEDVNSIIINPSENLSGLNTYYVLMDNGAITDNSGNGFVGIPSASGWNFSTAIDVSTPTIAATNVFVPADNSTAIELQPTFELEMSEPVRGVSGKFITVRATAAPATPILSVEADDILNVSIAASKVTIGPFGDELENNIEYFVHIPIGAFEDYSGNPTLAVIGGMAGDPDWTFTTLEDAIAPSITNLTPNINSNPNVISNQTFVMEFDETVQWGTGGSINLYYRDADGTSMATFDVTTNVNTVNEVPEYFDSGFPVFSYGTWTHLNGVASGAALANGGTGDAVILTTDGDHLTTPSRNDIDQVSFVYRSVDGTPASANVWASTDDGVTFTLDLGPITTTTLDYSATFTADPVSLYNGPVRIIKTGTDAAIIIDDFVYTSPTQLSFTADLISGGTDYYVTVTDLDGSNFAVTDVTNATDNAFAGYAASPETDRWKFKTANDGIAPVLTTAPTVPADDAVINVTSTDQIVLTFNELVNPQGGGDINIYYADAQLAHAIPVNSGTATFAVLAGGAVSFTYDIVTETGQELAGLTNYYVELEGGAFEDNDGTPNPNVIFGALGTWDISTTGDVVAPVHVNLLPVDDNNNVNSALVTSLRVHFSERVVASTGDLRVFLASNNYEIATISATSATIDNGVISGSRVTFPIELSGSTNYYVTLDTDAFQDATGNANTAIANDGSWNFRTAGETDNPIAMLLPNDDADLVLPITGLVGRFVRGETITGTSTGTADIVYIDDLNDELHVGNELITPLSDAEVVSGAAASATIGTQYLPSIGISDNLTLRFNEAVFTQGGKNITITGGPSPIVIPVLDAQVTGGGTDIITVNPTEPLHVATTYTVTVDVGSFKDASGISNNLINTWMFTTTSGAVVDNGVAGMPYVTPLLTACLFGDDINQQDDIVITELNNNDFADGNVGGVTLVLTLSSEFSFDVLETITVVNDNGTGNLTNVSGVVDEILNTITITYDNNGADDQLDALRITGLKIRQNTDNGASLGTLKRTGGSANIYGLDTSHDVTLLSLDVESVTAPTVNTYTNTAFCQGIDPDDAAGDLLVTTVDDFDLQLDATVLTITWYPELGAGGTPDYTSPIAAAANLTTPTYANLGIGFGTAGVFNVYASLTNTNGCESDPLELTVEIYALPDADAIAGADITGVCSFESITLGNPLNAGLVSHTFDWTGDNITATEDVANPSILTPQNTDDVSFLTEDHLYSLTVTDNNGCIDVGTNALTVTVDPRINVTLTEDNGTFSFVETDNIDINLTGSIGVGDFGSFSGSPGLKNIDVDNTIPKANAVFNTFDADAGTTILTYTQTDGTTGCFDDATLVYTITAAFDIAGGALVDEYCESITAVPFDFDIADLGVGGKIGWTYQGYKASGAGPAVTGPGGLITTGYNLHPNVAFADGTIPFNADGSKTVTIARVVNDGFIDKVDGFNLIIIQPLPVVTINNVDALYCMDNVNVTLDLTVVNNGNTENSPTYNNTITIFREDSPSSGTYVNDFFTITGTTINFANLAADATAGFGGNTERNYRVQITTVPGDDPFGVNLNGNTVGCPQIVTSDFTLYDLPLKPSITASARQVDLGGGQYLYEYCDSELGSFENLVRVGTGTTYIWYEDDGGGMPGNQIITANQDNMSIVDLFGTATPASGSEIFHVTQLNTFGNAGFAGCEGDFTTVTFEIYDTPLDPTLVSVEFEDIDIGSTSHYVREYCVGEVVQNVNIAAPSVVDETDFYDWYLLDGVTAVDAFNTTTDIVLDGVGEGAFAAAGNVSVTALEFMGVFGQGVTPIAGTYTLTFRKRENRNGTTNVFDGCQSSLIRVDIVVHPVPTVPSIADFNTDVNGCSGELTTLNTSTRMSVADDVETPGFTDIRYSWYPANAFANLIGVADEGADLTYDQIFSDANVTGLDNTADTEVTNTYYQVTTEFNVQVFLSQTTNFLNRLTPATSFIGCESTMLAPVDITVYPLAAKPNILPPNGDAVYTGGNNESVSYAQDELESTSAFLASTIFNNPPNTNTFNWYFSSVTLLPGSAVPNSDASLSAGELGLNNLPIDITNYFVINQTTDIESGGVTPFDGCESDYSALIVTTEGRPANPATTAIEIYYCAGETINSITTNGEENVGDFFYWYTTEADALAGINRLTVSGTGKTITSTEMIPDEVGNDLNANGIPDVVDFALLGGTDANANNIEDTFDALITGGADVDGDNIDDAFDPVVSNLGGTPGPGAGEFTFYVTQTTDIGNTNNTDGIPDFTGSESDPLEITVNVRSIPADPTLSAVTSEICDNGISSAIPTIQVLNPAGGLYNWIQEDAASVNGTLDGADIVRVDKGISNQYLPVYGDMTVGNAGNTNASNNYIVSQLTDRFVNGSSFVGCESNYMMFNITIHDIPAPPIIDGNGIADAYVYCADEAITTLTVANEVSYNVTATFNWYTGSTSSGNIFTSESIDGTIIRADDHSAWPTVDEFTNQTINYYITTVEDGCESSVFTNTNNTNVTVTINPLPVVDISYIAGPATSNEFCDGAPAFSIQGLHNASSPANNGLGGADPFGNFNVIAGLVDNLDGTATFTPATALGVSLSQTAHIITFEYTDANGCVNQTDEITDATEILKVNPLPVLELFSDDLVNLGDGVTLLFNTIDPSVQICENWGNFNLVGRPSFADGSGATSGTGQLFVDNVGLSTSSPTGSDHNATFLTANKGNNVPDNTINESFPVRFDFEEAATKCTNSIQKQVIVDVKPEVTFRVFGGCISPAVLFEAIQLRDSLGTGDTSPYSLTDLTLKWSYYGANPDGTANFNDFINSDGDFINTLEQFSIPDGQESESYATILIATSNFGCTSDLNQYTEQEVGILISPSIAYKWDAVTVGNPTTFFARETLLSLDKINTISVSYDNGANFTAPIPAIVSGVTKDDFPVFDTFQNTFSSEGKHEVAVVFKTVNTCTDTLYRSVNIVPLFDLSTLLNNSYIQSFDIEDNYDPDLSGWYVESLRDDVLNITEDSIRGTKGLRDFSWVWGELDLQTLGLTDNESPGARASKKGAWSTTVFDTTSTLIDDSLKYHYLSDEDSWLYSPAFNIQSLSKPMLKFNIIYDFEAANEGVVLQYSLDDGLTWIGLGSYNTDNDTNTGIEWYNFDNVQADPGQQAGRWGELASVGWAGAVEKPKWLSARHKLDEIAFADRDHVRFRFAIASTNVTKNGYFGFALDDFSIVERSKNVLIENFVSVSSEDGQDVNTPSDALLLAADAEVLSSGAADDITINYHSDFGFEDKINRENTSDPSARVAYYSVDNISSFLDGNANVEATNQLNWTFVELEKASLRDPGFEITVTSSSASDNEIKGSVKFVANTNFSAGTTFRAYVAILESTVTVSPAIGTFSNFNNVMRKLLPDGSGAFVELTSNLADSTLLPIGSVDDADGDELTLDIQWDLANISDVSQLTAVVFIQNNVTKEVYQSRKYDITHGLLVDKNMPITTDVDDLLTENIDFIMYPNPTDHEVFISFENAIQEDLLWTIFDQTGRVFNQGQLNAGEKGFDLSTDRLPSGLYYMSIRGEQIEFDFKKLMIVH